MAVLLVAWASLGWCAEARVSLPLLMESVLIDTANPSFDRIKFTFEAPPATESALLTDQKNAAVKAIEFFFIGLAVPQERLWVNLNPDEPGRMIDPVLKDTDLGKFVLAADLQLKKDIAVLTNPRMSEGGRQYWDKLYAKAEELGIEDKIPVANRVWIVPDVAQVSEIGDRLEIISSSLKIYLESEYINGEGKINDPKQQELTSYANRLLSELIIPVLTQKVNRHAAYSDLRAAYQALLLAQWYKKRSSASPDYFLRNSASTALKDASTDLDFRAEQIYREYLSSLQKGEYNFSESRNSQLDFYLSVITRDYFSGGVDLRAMKTEIVPEKIQAKTNRRVYSAEIYLPKKYSRPLEFVKNKLALKTEEPFDVSHVALAENLPKIVPGQFNESALAARENFSRAVLSNL